MPAPSRSRGFTITDLTATIALLAIAAALALAATRQMRQEAQNASSLSQLRWMAGATASYAADNQERFWTFSWRAGVLPHSDPTLPMEAATDLHAASVQGIDIIRRLTGRTDMPMPSSWIPHVLYTHLPLVDYVGASLPDFNLVAPGDTYRLNWARDPDAFDRGEFLPFQPDPSGSPRWPYSSSYLAPAAWWNPNNRVAQGTSLPSHHYYSIPVDSEWGGAAMHDVTYPSQKVMVHDTEQRELGSAGRYCVADEARVAVLMADGSAGMKASIDANRGWNPTHPTSSTYTRLNYVPSAWEAPVGPSGSTVIGYYRWTRGGIEGRDFGGPEIDTGQP